MILDKKINDDFKEINLFKLSEETIRTINYLMTNVDDKGTLQEYYSYIDQLINYFNHKKNIILSFSRKKIDSIYSSKKSLVNRNFDKLNVDSLMLRVPNKYFLNIPKYDILNSDRYIEKWDFSENKKFSIFSNIYSAKYKKIIKSMTKEKCTKFSDINNLIDKISDYEKINCNKKDMEEYINKLPMCQDDIKNIIDFINRYIEALNNLKGISVLSLEKSNSFKNSIIEALKMVEIKTIYVNCIINILFNIYLSKLKLFIPNINVEEEDDILISESVFNLFNNSFELLDESYICSEYGYDESRFRLVKDKFLEIKGDKLYAVKIYLDLAYTTAIKSIEKYYNLEALKYLDFFDIKNKEFLFKSINNIKDHDIFIEKYKNYFMMKYSCPKVYVDINDDRKILKDFISHKEEIINELNSDYNTIIKYIDLLRNDNSIDYSKLFEKNYKNLTIFSISEIETLENKLNSLGIEIPYEISYNNKIYGELIQKINMGFERPQRIIEILDRYLLLINQSDQMISYITEPISIDIDKNEFPNSNKLLAYLIFFQNKCLDACIL